MSPKLLTGAARAASSSLLRAQSDTRLAGLARAGHPAAFEAIVARYRGELLRYCTGLVGPGRAEDAVQQTFLNAHVAMRSTDTLRLRPWLYRIAHNAALNLLRSSRDETPIDERHAAPGTLELDLEVRHRLRAALAAIAALPEPQRDALMLQAVEGRSHEEIAAALAVTPAAARQTVHRARATLRAAVTAITPYPLIARLATGPLPGSAPELASAGKLGAAVLAAGAIAGGAVTLPAERPVKAPSVKSASRPAQTRKPAEPRPPASAAAAPAGDQRETHDASPVAAARRVVQAPRDSADDDHSGPAPTGSAEREDGHEDRDHAEDDARHEDTERAETEDVHVEDDHTGEDELQVEDSYGGDDGSEDLLAVDEDRSGEDDGDLSDSSGSG